MSDTIAGTLQRVTLQSVLYHHYRTSFVPLTCWATASPARHAQISQISPTIGLENGVSGTSLGQTQAQVHNIAEQLSYLMRTTKSASFMQLWQFLGLLRSERCHRHLSGQRRKFWQHSSTAHLCFNITMKGQTIVPDWYNRNLQYTRKYVKNNVFQWKFNEILIQYCLVVDFR